MEWFMKIKYWLAGKKTVIVAVSGWLTALAAYVSGGLDGAAFVAATYAALTAIFLRAGVAKK